MFEGIEKQKPNTIIKVFGVGGAGGNAVDHMVRKGVHGVEFIVADTDAQTLKRSAASSKLQLDKSDLGTGAKTEIGRDAAVSERGQIAEALKGAHMLFIMAGMGGSTGTGAAPAIAEIARDLGILTVAVVTQPFASEGQRVQIAETGIAELQKHVDSLIVVLNDHIGEAFGKDISMVEAFKAVDNVLRNAVVGIAGILNSPRMVNVDFEDVRDIMSEAGRAMIGFATASGQDRARLAAGQAVASPLLKDVTPSSAMGVLVNITASCNLKMRETVEIMNTVRKIAANDAQIIFGVVSDESMNDELRVTLVVTGLQRSRPVVTPAFLRRGNEAPALKSIPGGYSGDAESDPLYDQAVAVVLKFRRASISLVQRHLRIGYNRSVRLIEAMGKAGLVSDMDARGKREVLERNTDE